MTNPIAAALTAVGSIAGGIEQRKAARRSAAADRESARRTILEGEFAAQDTRRQERLLIGQSLAGAAGDGVPIGTGTIADLIEFSARQREEEILGLRYERALESQNLLAAAKEKKRAGNAALFGGLIGAGTAIAGGIADSRASARLDAARARDRADVLGGGRTGAVRPQGPVSAALSGSLYGNGILPGDGAVSGFNRRFRVFNIPGL